jgi:hypothetical protein
MSHGSTRRPLWLRGGAAPQCPACPDRMAVRPGSPPCPCRAPSALGPSAWSERRGRPGRSPSVSRDAPSPHPPRCRVGRWGVALSFVAIGNVLAPMIGHAVIHACEIVRGGEIPPYQNWNSRGHGKQPFVAASTGSKANPGEHAGEKSEIERGRDSSEEEI